MREKSGGGREDSDPQQTAAGEPKERSENAIDDAQTDGVGCAANEPADEEDEQHDSDGNKHEGKYVAGGIRDMEDVIQQRCQQGGEVLVVPTGEEDAGDEPADGEELKHDAAQEGGDGRPDKDGDEETVE